jgi:mono/diheme cytochrome c family protein
MNTWMHGALNGPLASGRAALRLLVGAVFLTLGGQAVAEDGAALYMTFCAACHQAAGTGIPSVFPPLVGHAATLEAAEGGRRYLAEAVVYGVQGALVVNGTTYDGVMPAWGQLSDVAVAAILNHVLGLDGAGTAAPYDEAEIAAARSEPLSPSQVRQRRPDLEAAEVDAPPLPTASFTAAQVSRARPIYERLCVGCHGEDFTGGLIGGPPLRGGAFLNRWGGRSVAPLFTYTRTQMPQGGPNSLPAQQYADLIALILSVNGHEAGETEMGADLDELERIGVREP